MLAVWRALDRDGKQKRKSRYYASPRPPWPRGAARVQRREPRFDVPPRPPSFSSAAAAVKRSRRVLSRLRPHTNPRRNVNVRAHYSSGTGSRASVIGHRCARRDPSSRGSRGRHVGCEVGGPRAGSYISAPRGSCARLWYSFVCWNDRITNAPSFACTDSSFSKSTVRRLSSWPPSLAVRVFVSAVFDCTARNPAACDGHPGFRNPTAIGRWSMLRIAVISWISFTQWLVRKRLGTRAVVFRTRRFETWLTVVTRGSYFLLRCRTRTLNWKMNARQTSIVFPGCPLARYAKRLRLYFDHF